MKKLLLSLSLFGLATMAVNAESMYMHIVRNDGTVAVLDIDQVERLTFKDGVMTATKGNTELGRFDHKDVAAIVFDEETELAGVDNINANSATLQLHNGVVEVPAGCGATLDIYDAAGRRAAAVPNMGQGGRVDINGLATGTYIIKVGEISRKILVK